MLVAIAFLCLSTSIDCKHEAITRAVVGQGSTPIGCLMDGQAGAAANAALAHGDNYRLVIVCQRRPIEAITAPNSIPAPAQLRRQPLRRASAGVVE